MGGISPVNRPVGADELRVADLTEVWMSSAFAYVGFPRRAIEEVETSRRLTLTIRKSR